MAWIGTDPLINQPKLSLKEYRRIAISSLSVQAARYSQTLKIEMLNNEEAITDVVTNVILADCRFDGRGTIEGYRSEHVLFAIKKYLSEKIYRTSRESTNWNYSHYTSTSDLKSVSNIDYLEKILEDLTPRDAKILKMRFLEDMTLDEISKKMDLTRERIRQIEDECIEKLRKKYKGRYHGC